MLDFIIISLFVIAFVAGAYVVGALISFVADLLVELSDVAVELAVVTKDAIANAVIEISEAVSEAVSDNDDIVADETDVADDDYITINAVPTIAPFINKGIANNIDIAGLTNIDGTAYYMSYPADVANTTDTDVANTTDYLSTLLNHDFYSMEEVDYSNYNIEVAATREGIASIGGATAYDEYANVIAGIKGVRKDIASSISDVYEIEVKYYSPCNRNKTNYSRIRKVGKVERIRPDWRM